MKATLEKSDLSAALVAVERVIERRSSIPILSNIRLEAGGSLLMITGTDLDMCASNAAAADVLRAGAVTVPGTVLKDIIAKLPDGAQVSFETATETTLTIRAGRSRYTLQTLPAADFPEFKPSADGVSFELPAATVQRMLEATEFAISKEETRYYLCGAYLHTVDRNGQQLLCIAATDGHRLSQITAPLPAGAEALAGVIIPSKAVAEIKRLATATPGSLHIDVSTSAIRVRAGSHDLISKLIDGQYPDYLRVMPANNSRIAAFDRDEMANAVARVATLMSKASKAIRIEIREGEIGLGARCDDGEASEVVDATCEGEPGHVGFNGKYLELALAAMGAGDLQICMDEPTSPTLLRRPDAPEHVIVLMPMRA